MLYDAFGREVVAVEVTNAYFLNAPYVRVLNGRLQVKNETDNLWYTIILQNDPSTGHPVLGTSDTGTAL